MAESICSKHHALFTLCLLLLIVSIGSVGHAQEPEHQAGLVIQFADNQVQTFCIGFSEPTITGLELLERTNLPLSTQSQGMGAAVCSIDSQGCNYPNQACFCGCSGGACKYWALQKLENQRWVYANVGASAITVQPGEVYGWAWGAGNVEQGQEPPVMSFEQICTVPATGTALATTIPAGTTTPAPAAPVLPSPTTVGLPSSPLEPTSYGVFVALVALLIGIIAVAQLRRRR